MTGLLLVVGTALLLAQHSQCRTFGSRSVRYVGPMYYAENGNGNAYIDKVMTNVRAMIHERGLDPYTAINVDLLGVHISGALSGLGSLHRGGEATISYEGDAIEVDAVFSVYDLSASLGWKTKILLWTVEGSATGSISEAIVRARLRADLSNPRVVITDFTISHIGSINTQLHFTPIPIIDNILSLLTDTVANVLKNVVVSLLEGPIQQIVQLALDKIGIPEQE